MIREVIISEDERARTVEVWDGDDLLHVYTQSVQSAEEPSPAADIVAAIEAMTPDQLATLRAALGLS